MMAAAPLVRVTADHLALVRSLITSGQTGRAMELLDSVWHPRVAEEQCWYLKLWVLAMEGRVMEALELSRVAARELPGSAAVAYLQAALEHAMHSPALAQEAANRAALIAPDHPMTRMMVAILSGTSQSVETGTSEAPTLSGGNVVPDSSTAAPVNVPPSLIAAAQMGASLLYPLGSGKALIPVVDPSARKAIAVPPLAFDRRRFGLVAAATVICALWAIQDPVPAALALGVTVLLATRVGRS